MESNTTLAGTGAHDEVDFERRFGGIGRLYGARALERFRTAHICVIGVGGVGSWAVESLARSAIGELTLIDLDNVAESNVNRQIQALTSTIGMPKIDALAARIAEINPFCKVNLVEDFVAGDNLDQFVGARRFDYVFDAIDSVRAKTALIAYCAQHQIPLITSGGAGGKVDPTKVAVRDLSKTEQEPLLAKVRRRLRTAHGFPRGSKNNFHIDAVFSTEPLKFPDGDEASCSLDSDDRSGVTGLNCAGFGSTMVVTAGFGMAAVAHILNKLADAAVHPKAALLS